MKMKTFVQQQCLTKHVLGGGPGAGPLHQGAGGAEEAGQGEAAEICEQLSSPLLGTNDGLG
jgi:hypothetical protein